MQLLNFYSYCEVLFRFMRYVGGVILLLTGLLGCVAENNSPPPPTRAILTITPEAGFEDYNFGPQHTDKTTQKTLTIENIGKEPAQKMAYTMTGEFGFVGGSYPGTGGTCGEELPIKETCTLVIEFAPDSAGDLVGTVNVEFFDDVDTENLTAQFTGFGVHPATRIIIEDPQDTFATLSSTVTVRAVDDVGTTDILFASDVTLNVDGNATGDGFVDLIEGEGSLVITDLWPETVNLTLTDSEGTGLDVSSTQDLVFQAAPAVEFVLLDPTDTEVNFPATINVEARNQFGNVDVTFNDDVTLNTSGSATGAGLINVTMGVGSIIINNLVAELVSLTLTDSQGTGLDVTSTQDILFTPGPAVDIFFADPPDQTVGNNVYVYLRALDAFGNVDYNFEQDVTFNVTGSATGSGLIDIVDGLATVTVYNTVAEIVTLSLVDSEGTGLPLVTTHDVEFIPGVLDHFNVVGHSDPIIAGTQDSITVTAVDQFNNTLPTYLGTVTFSSDDPQAVLPPDYTFLPGDAGIHTFVNGIELRTTGDHYVEVAHTLDLLKNGQQSNITVLPAAIDHFSVTGVADPTTADDTHTVTVTAFDQFNNIKTDYTGTIHFTSDDPSPLLPADTAFVLGDAGVKNIAGVELHTTGTYYVEVNDTVTLAATGQQAGIDVNPGALTHFTLASIADPVVAGTQESPVVTAYDQYNNIKTDYVGTVQFSTDDPLGIVPLNYNFLPADFGVHTFTNEVELRTVGSYYVRVEDTGDITKNGEQTNIDVTHAAADHLTWSTQPANNTLAGEDLLPVIEVRDQFENIVTTGADSTALITVSINTGPGGATLSGDFDINAVNGVATWTAVQSMDVDKVGTYTLIADDGTRNAVSASFDILHGPADHLTWSTQPANNTLAGDDLLPVIEIRDVFENIVTTGVDSTALITLTINTGPGGATLGGDVDINAVAGVATWTGTEALDLDKVGAYTINADDGTRNTNSASFDIIHAPADHLTWSTQPANNTVAGTDLLPVVEVRDAFENIVTTGADSTALVTLSINTQPGGAALAGDVDLNFVAGVATWTATEAMNLDKSGSYTLNADDGTRNTNSVSFDIVHAPADHLTWATQPANNTVAGTDLLPSVEVRDQFENIVTTGADSTALVTITINTQPGGATLAGDFDINAVAGVATWTATEAMYLDKVGSYTLNADDGTRNANSASFDIIHAPADHLTWATQPANNTIAGDDLLPVVEIRDQFENIITTGADSTATITLSINTGPGTATLGGDVDINAVAGVATWTGTEALDLDKVGTYTLNADDGTRNANSASFDILHAPADHLTWATQPVNNTPAGDDLVPSIEVRDQFENVVTTGAASTALVTITINTQPGGATLGGDVDINFVAGVATWTAVESLDLDKSGTYILNADDGTRNANSASFDILHAAPDHLTWATQPANNTIAGDDLLPSIEVRDIFENIVNTGAESTALITLTINTGPGGATLGGDFDINPVAGVATWTGTEALDLDKVGTYTLNADNGSRNANSASFDILHAPADHLTWSTQPANNTVAGTDLLPVVEVRDAFENIVTTGADSTALVTLSINTQPGGATLAGDVDLNFVAGVATWTAVEAMNLDKVGSYTLNADDGTRNANSASFDIIHAPADHLTWATQPVNNTVAGDNLLPSIEVRDQFENVVSTGADSTALVTITINTQPGGATLAGDVDLNFVAGVATWTATEAMFLDKVGS